MGNATYNRGNVLYAYLTVIVKETKWDRQFALRLYVTYHQSIGVQIDRKWREAWQWAV